MKQDGIATNDSEEDDGMDESVTADAFGGSTAAAFKKKQLPRWHYEVCFCIICVSVHACVWPLNGDPDFGVRCLYFIFSPLVDVRTTPFSVCVCTRDRTPPPSFTTTILIIIIIIIR